MIGTVNYLLNDLAGVSISITPVYTPRASSNPQISMTASWNNTAEDGSDHTGSVSATVSYDCASGTTTAGGTVTDVYTAHSGDDVNVSTLTSTWASSGMTVASTGCHYHDEWTTSYISTHNGDTTYSHVMVDVDDGTWTLSNPNTLGTVQTKAGMLLALWNMTDDILLPWGSYGGGGPFVTLNSVGPQCRRRRSSATHLTAATRR